MLTMVVTYIAYTDLADIGDKCIAATDEIPHKMSVIVIETLKDMIKTGCLLIMYISSRLLYTDKVPCIWIIVITE